VKRREAGDQEQDGGPRADAISRRKHLTQRWYLVAMDSPQFRPDIVLCPVCPGEPYVGSVTYLGTDARRLSYVYEVMCHGEIGYAFHSREAVADGRADVMVEFYVDDDKICVVRHPDGRIERIAQPKRERWAGSL
jgi:hypothetical protein